MPTADVTVIIPTYNRLSMLLEALESVFVQDFDGAVDVIVVDDNSQDGTSEFVKERYPDVHLISFKQNSGAYVARNQAILASNSQYIAFLDSDDLWHPTYLKTQIAALAGQEKCFCASAVVDWQTVENQKSIVLPEPNLEKYSSPLHHLLAEGSFVCTPSAVVFPRRVFNEVGLFDPNYRISGDNDLYIRCLLQGYRLICTESPIVTRRRHDQGQATDWSNLRIRKRNRLRQVEHHHHLAKQCFILPPIHVVRAQVHGFYASHYYIRQRKILSWLNSSLCAVCNSPECGLPNLWRDVHFCVNHFILRDLQPRLKRKFFDLFGIVHSA